MKRFLITGITGFAGPNLANLLIKEGHKVAGLIRHSNGRETDILDIVSEENFSKIEFIQGDLSNRRSINKIFEKEKFDGIFHLAAQSHPPTGFADPIGTWDTNVTGSLNLFQAIEDYNPECKIMFCSTSEVYGNVGSDARKIKTTDILFPSNPYGSSKAAIDLYLQERFENKKLTGFITRAFSHTGIRRGKTFSISSDAYQIAKMVLGKQEKVLQVGNLDTVRVVMDVRDTVNAYYKLMMTDASNNRIFNICGDTPRKMGFYTDLLIAESGLSGITKEINTKFYRPIDIYYQHGDMTDVTDITDWKEQYTIEQTMKDLLNYWIKKLS
jgi:GDP-4-dehydro-6-deoxy-D-mannose reductase